MKYVHYYMLGMVSYINFRFNSSKSAGLAKRVKRVCLKVVKILIGLLVFGFVSKSLDGYMY